MRRWSLRVEHAFRCAALLSNCHPEEGVSPTKDLRFADAASAGNEQQISRSARDDNSLG